MQCDHAAILFDILRIVVPIHQTDLFVDAFRHLRRKVLVGRIITAEGIQKMHIAPHHGRKPQFFADSIDPCYMAHHHFMAVRTTVSQIPCFIHADVNAARSKTSADGGNHLFNERVSRLFIY